MSIQNNYAYVNPYKQSFKGKITDYTITFNENQTDIQQILYITRDLFEQLIQSFPNNDIYARLVAKVSFQHFNNFNNENEERFYHFASYSTEKVVQPNEFFDRHMTKIASRLDAFNENGSNLLLKGIPRIHILLSLLSKTF